MSARLPVRPLPRRLSLTALLPLLATLGAACSGTPTEPAASSVVTPAIAGAKVIPPVQYVPPSNTCSSAVGGCWTPLAPVVDD